jgi:hypothetical protein
MRNTESGGEDRLDDRVELSRRRQVAAERLLDDDPAPLPVLLLGEPGAPELLGDDGERLRRDRQVEGVVAHRAAVRIQFGDRLPSVLERGVVVEFSGDEADALRQLLPDVLVERGARILLDRVVDDALEVLVLPVPTREPDQARSLAAAARGWRGRTPPA